MEAAHKQGNHLLQAHSVCPVLSLMAIYKSEEVKPEKLDPVNDVIIAWAYWIRIFDIDVLFSLISAVL